MCLIYCSTMNMRYPIVYRSIFDNLELSTFTSSLLITLYHMAQNSCVNFGTPDISLYEFPSSLGIHLYTWYEVVTLNSIWSIFTIFGFCSYNLTYILNFLESLIIRIHSFYSHTPNDWIVMSFKRSSSGSRQNCLIYSRRCSLGDCETHVEGFIWKLVLWLGSSLITNTVSDFYTILIVFGKRIYSIH